MVYREYSQKSAMPYFLCSKKVINIGFQAPHVINSWMSGIDGNTPVNWLAHIFQWFSLEGVMYNDYQILPGDRLQICCSLGSSPHQKVHQFVFLLMEEIRLTTKDDDYPIFHKVLAPSQVVVLISSIN